MLRLTASTVLLLTGSLFFSACGDPDADRPHPHRPAVLPPPSHQIDDGGSVEPGPSSDNHPERVHAEGEAENQDHSGHANPAVTKPTPPPPAGSLEYGKNVPGRPGFVTSPYAPYSGYVDVRGFPPGSEVKDPYTGKNFLVPAQ
jgi:hypothetical protein